MSTIELLTLPFFQRALVVGVVLAVLMALLGVLIVLRRMSFIADALGHSALAGIGAGLALGGMPFVGAVVVVVLLAILISWLRRTSALSIDTLLGVLFPAALAFGVLTVSLTPGYQPNLIAFLFGDILTVQPADIITSLVLLVVTVATLVVAGKRFVLITLDESFAAASGVNVARHELVLLTLLAVLIVLAIKLVGVILVTALLIIPAASAQNISRSLMSMFAVSVVLGVTAVVVGLLLSALIALPSGPLIVLTSAVLFALTYSLRLMGVRV